MDTGTHLIMGIGLGGLAMIDPVVAANPAIGAAVIFGTIAGSQAPDLDTLLRIRGNAVYIRNHRGISHSIPAILIWTALITGVLQLIFRGSLPWLHVAGWVLLACVVHVLTDLFNAYGTQAMRPFNDKWISWNVIHIFDPVIFTTHFIAILLWAFGLASPQAIFPLLYLFTAVYLVWRTMKSKALLGRLPELDPLKGSRGDYLLIPTISLTRWNVVKKTGDGTFAIGRLKGEKLNWLDHVKCSSHPAVAKSKNDHAVRSFLYLTKFACAETIEYEWGYEVRWSDVRYRHRKQFPFVAVLLMNKQFETVGSYVGWQSPERLAKKLRMNSY